MSHSMVLKFTAVLATVFGLALLLAPDTIDDAVQSGKVEHYRGWTNTMLYGALLLGVAVINWKTSTVDAEQAQAVISGNLLYCVLSLVVALYRQLFAGAPPAAWGNVGLFVVLTLLFGQLTFASAKRAAGDRRRVA